ncbi:MAG: hypothetical protein ACMUHY_00250 [Thermoplasmatota archaeon]
MDDEYNSLYGDLPESKEMYGRPSTAPGAPFDNESRLNRRKPLYPERSSSSGAGAMVFVAIGLILIFIGAIFGSLVWVIEDPEEDDYDDWDDYEKASETHERIMRWFTFVNEILWTAGGLVLSGGLLGVALLIKDINPQVKVGLLIGAALILGFMMANRTGLLGILAFLD